jgi:gamma-glutamylcyclotransferase (GGCT)/AIG2-like uncharacterized protein YtfP
MSRTVNTLFVYGTLRPGDVRWHFLAPFAADHGVDDGVDGHLFDTGLGYPAALFGPDPTGTVRTIRGRRYELRVDLLDEALRVLDVEESSVAGLYRRVLVTTHAGHDAWAYEYGTGLELTPIPGGDWLAR